MKTFPLGKEILSEQENGWISYEIAKKETRPAWCWKISKKAGDARVEFLTALVPYREGQTPSEVEASVSADGDCRLFSLKRGQINRKINLDLAKKSAVFQ